MLFSVSAAFALKVDKIVSISVKDDKGKNRVAFLQALCA